MQEKKLSDSIEKGIAAMKEYKASLEKMSPKERSEHEKKKQAWAKELGLTGKRVIDGDKEYLVKSLSKH